MDSLPLCLQEHVISYLRAHDADAVGMVCKDWRKIQLEAWKRAKWDNIMTCGDKVLLERLVVAVGYPELREKAQRYVLGKTKFAYKNVTIALNRAKDPDNIYIVTDHGKLEIRWTEKSKHDDNFDILWGCSVRCRRASGQSFASLDDIWNAFHFLFKLCAASKPIRQDAMECIKKLLEYLHELRGKQSMDLCMNNLGDDQHDPYQWFWAKKEKSHGWRVDKRTMLDYQVLCRKGINT
jgi:hypothetical protein